MRSPAPPCRVRRRVRDPGRHPGSGAFRSGPGGRLAWGLVRRFGGLAALGLALAGCGGEPRPVPPGEPIAAPAEVALGTMEVECDALLAAFAAYKQCPNLEADDRGDIDAWIDRAQQDFAAGKKANPEPNARHAIAAACRKAVASVTAANERCHNGPKPRQ